MEPCGRAIQRYGSPTWFEGRISGATVYLDVSGTVRFTFTTHDNTVTYHDFDVVASNSGERSGLPSTTARWNRADPAQYTRDSDHLVVHNSSFEVRMGRAR